MTNLGMVFLFLYVVLSALQKELMKYEIEGMLWLVVKQLATAKGGFPG